MRSLHDILSDLDDRPVGSDAERVRIGDQHVAIVSAEALGRALSPWVSLSGEFSRAGAYGLLVQRPGDTEPRPVDPDKLADVIRQAVATDGGGHDHVADLAEFAYRGGDRAHAYFRRALKSFRASLPAPHRSRVARTTPAQKRASEERLRAAERSTADFIVRGMVADPEEPSFVPAGYSLPAAELHDEILATASELVSGFESFDPAREGYESYAEMADDLGLPSRPRMPRRPVIIEALLAAGFERYRTGSGNRYRRRATDA